MQTTERLMTPDELASYLGISVEAEYDLNESGKGPPRIRGL